MSVTKNTITRRDLAAIVAEEHELTMAQSERIVKSVFDTIVDVRLVLFVLYDAFLFELTNNVLVLFSQKVSDKGVVRIADFGCFDSMTAKARTYKPPSGEVVEKPATVRCDTPLSILL
jgi:nucleoid DNA-binding protein